MRLITAATVPPSPARVHEPAGPPVRIGVVQHAWDPDGERLRATLLGGIRTCADAGAQVVFLPELTLSRYPADTEPDGRPDDLAESLEDGPTMAFAREAAAATGAYVHASLYEKSSATDRTDDGLGFNTAFLVAPDGTLVGRTRKTHIPVTAGYHEDKYFRPGPATDAYPVYDVDGLGMRLGLPTCWDEWFPEVARAYAIGGAQVLVYPTAIGSEPDHPDFDTQPLWEHTLVGHAIANGLFVVVPNRFGPEGVVTFYGSSFVADPYGRVLVRAPRDEAAALVVDLDLAQGRDWLDLFPFLATRRPDSYSILAAPVRAEHRREG
ncbi:MAG: nitrilase-related carbon-nitrogen hydrolase [Dermatophilaceae bacterium]